MSADVTVAWLRAGAIRVSRFVFKDFKIGTELAAKESDLFHDGAWMHVQVLCHPVVITLEWPQAVDVFTPDDVAEEDCGLLYIGHSEANVVGAPKARYS